MSENLTIPAEEDEFLGLGDDLFKQERKKALSLPPEPTKKELRLKKTPLQKALRVMMKRAGISKFRQTRRFLKARLDQLSSYLK